MMVSEKTVNFIEKYLKIVGVDEASELDIRMFEFKPDKDKPEFFNDFIVINCRYGFTPILNERLDDFYYSTQIADCENLEEYNFCIYTCQKDENNFSSRTFYFFNTTMSSRIQQMLYGILVNEENYSDLIVYFKGQEISLGVKFFLYESELEIVKLGKKVSGVIQDRIITNNDNNTPFGECRWTLFDAAGNLQYCDNTNEYEVDYPSLSEVEGNVFVNVYQVFFSEQDIICPHTGGVNSVFINKEEAEQYVVNAKNEYPYLNFFYSYSEEKDGKLTERVINCNDPK